MSYYFFFCFWKDVVAKISVQMCIYTVKKGIYEALLSQLEPSEKTQM